jgi:DNA excision repair protein ERCC-4
MDDIPDAPPGLDETFDSFYGLLAPQQTVLVRSYSDDADDRLLAEIRPRFIVLFEPSLDFVRRIEVYRSSNPGLNVRVYFMVWQLSCEEHKFLAAQRKEKDAFERLIKERGVSDSFPSSNGICTSYE